MKNLTRWRKHDHIIICSMFLKSAEKEINLWGLNISIRDERFRKYRSDFRSCFKLVNGYFLAFKCSLICLTAKCTFTRKLFRDEQVMDKKALSSLVCFNILLLAFKGFLEFAVLLQVFANKIETSFQLKFSLNFTAIW